MVAGLSAVNRAFLSRLNRELPRPFTVADAAIVGEVGHERAARLLRDLTKGGWLVRLQRGLYVTVPLEAEDPRTWSADPWAIANAALSPGYVGGWTALHHWDLTDQIFSTTVFITSRSVPSRKRKIGPAQFELRHRPPSALFGTRTVWREGVPVPMSDRERTLVDCLDDPLLGGGLRHTAGALTSYAADNDPAWTRIIEYGERLGNLTVFKRLGYLLETLQPGDKAIVDECRIRISGSVGRLDPARPPGGPTSKRWGLQLNVRLKS
jgi:predicted transcriptional regulator of viral defense system